MKYLQFFFLAIILSISSLYAAFNDRHYEGINKSWEVLEKAPNRLTLINEFLPQNPTVFEVGAYDGSDTITLAKMWPTGKIISFEPNPNQFEKFKAKTLYLPNVFGYNLAVNTYNGEATFYLCWGTGGNNPIFEGASSLLESSEEMKIHYMGPQITVPCVIFDDWCQNNNVQTIDFMWLDLEGFEKQFLSSSPKILKTVSVIYAETNFFKFRKGTTEFSDLKSFLENHGFKIIAHWYGEGLQGNAIFVRTELLKYPASVRR